MGILLTEKKGSLETQTTEQVCLNNIFVIFILSI